MKADRPIRGSASIKRAATQSARNGAITARSDRTDDARSRSGAAPSRLAPTRTRHGLLRARGTGSLKIAVTSHRRTTVVRPLVAIRSGAATRLRAVIRSGASRTEARTDVIHTERDSSDRDPYNASSRSSYPSYARGSYGSSNGRSSYPSYARGSSGSQPSYSRARTLRTHMARMVRNRHTRMADTRPRILPAVAAVVVVAAVVGDRPHSGGGGRPPR